MGKLMNRLLRQLENPETKKDAESCIKIYNWLRDTDPAKSVWESRWTPLVRVEIGGAYPNNKYIHTPTNMGYTLLKGIECYQVNYLSKP